MMMRRTGCKRRTDWMTSDMHDETRQAESGSLRSYSAVGSLEASAASGTLSPQRAQALFVRTVIDNDNKACRTECLPRYTACLYCHIIVIRFFLYITVRLKCVGEQPWKAPRPRIGTARMDRGSKPKPSSVHHFVADARRRVCKATD
jgi:hypothetical protein